MVVSFFVLVVVVVVVEVRIEDVGTVVATEILFGECGCFSSGATTALLMVISSVDKIVLNGGF